jgi:ribosomal protein S11
MSASVGWRVYGYEPIKKRGKIVYDDERKPKALTPPFAAKSAADEFAQTLKERGYQVSGVKWYGAAEK